MHMFLPSYFVFRSKKKFSFKIRKGQTFTQWCFMERGEKGNIDNKKGDLFWQDNKEEMVWTNVKFFIIKSIKKMGVIYKDHFLPNSMNLLMYWHYVGSPLSVLTLLTIKGAIWSWTLLEHINLLKKKNSL